MYNSANFAGASKGALHVQLVVMLKHCFFILKMNTTQFRPEYFFYFLLSKGQNFFPTLGGQITYFINNQTPLPPQNQMVVPKINQEINEPSYEMVGVKITVTNYGQNNRIFGLFFLVDFLFSFLTLNSKCFHHNGFEMYILIIIYTVCTCDTLVPTRFL